MRISNHISSVAIIQSIGPGELNNGRHFRETILDMQPQIPSSLSVTLEDIPNAAGLLQQIQAIRNSTAAHGGAPILHFECHGNRTGLQLSDGSSISWPELHTHLADLNRATRCNLLVVIGACESAWAAELLLPEDRPAFWGFLAPRVPVAAGIARGAYAAFYRRLLLTGDGDAALADLRAVPGASDIFYFATVEYMFRLFYREYWKGHGSREATWHRAREIRDRWRSDNDRRASRSLQDIVLDLKRSERSRFEKMRYSYFLLDQCPENAARFHVDYDELLRQVAEPASAL